MIKRFQGKKILIMGLGLHGGALSVVKWLLRNKAILTITDTKTRAQLKPTLDKLAKIKGSKNIKFRLGGHDIKDFADQDLIVQNPGVPPQSKYLKHARKQGIPIVNEAVMFFGLYPGYSIGVTGTRGKSTTATLIHQILKTEIKSNVVAGNIATSPMFDVLGKLKVKSLPVVELSSWHLENMAEYKVSPHISVVTNVLKDHLNRYKNFAAYKHAKQIIVEYQLKNDIAVLNRDNTHSYSFRKYSKGKTYFYSLSPSAMLRTGKKLKGAYLKNENIFFFDGKKIDQVMPIDKIKLLGDHNLSNILAAVTVAKIVGIKNKNIARAVNRFKGVDYRLEYKRTIDGVKIYNDSTSTTPDSTIAAIDAMNPSASLRAGKNILLIAGGEDKELDYGQLAKKIKSKVKYLVLLDGSGSRKLLAHLKKNNFKNYTAHVKSLKAAWQIAGKNMDGKDVILFSPAGASFNMFKNEFDRARQFDAIINGHKNKKKKN